MNLIPRYFSHSGFGSGVTTWNAPIKHKNLMVCYKAMVSFHDCFPLVTAVLVLENIIKRTH